MSPAPARTTEADIWEHVIRPRGKMTVQTARHIVQLDFTPDERSRMHELAEKGQAGVLSPEDESELDHYCRVGTMLSILQSRARQVLKPRGRSAKTAHGSRTR